MKPLAGKRFQGQPGEPTYVLPPEGGQNKSVPRHASPAEAEWNLKNALALKPCICAEWTGCRCPQCGGQA